MFNPSYESKSAGGQSRKANLAMEEAMKAAPSASKDPFGMFKTKPKNEGASAATAQSPEGTKKGRKPAR
jgi:hypothetical protein